MRLYAARHGQTEWNVLWKNCGTTDVPLNELGVAQAHELAQAAEKHPIHLIISSPMIRARQTAQVIADRMHIPVLTDQRLVEQNYGIFEGGHRKDPEFLRVKRNFPTRYPGGESMLDVAARIFPLLDEIKEKYPDKNVLIVCHGGVLRLVRAYFEDMTNEEFFNYSEKNATLLCYEY